MVDDCPHSHEPVPHAAQFDADGPQVQACGACGGLLRRCDNCEALNRLAARHCRSCGRELRRLDGADRPLPVPGELDRRLRDAKPQPFSAVFPLAEDAAPVHWLIGPDGVYLFAEQAHLGQATLLRAATTEFPEPVARELTTSAQPLPTSNRWLSAPVANAHGAFVASAEALHYFSAHGDTQYLRQRRWSAPAGQRIEAVGWRDNGHCALLIGPATDTVRAEVTLYDGNTQLRDWQPVLTLDLPAAQGCGYAAGPAAGVCDADLWVYNGTEVVFIALGKTAVITRRLPTDGGQAPLPNLRDCLRRGFFQPLVLVSAIGTKRFVFPAAPRDGAAAAIGVLDLGARGSRIWGDIGVGDWLRPDPWGEGLFVRRNGALVHLLNGAAVWSSDPGFSGLPPTLTRGWMLAVKSAGAGVRDDLANELNLNLLELLRTADGLHIDSLTTFATGYRVIPGLPPLVAGGWLVFAGDSARLGEPMLTFARIGQ